MIWLALSALSHVRIFNVPTGVFWQGEIVKHDRRTGLLILMKARRVTAGLCPGGSDQIGWTTIEITPEMVGSRIAVFTAIECKRQDGRASEEQVHFIQTVSSAGGFAGIARSPEEALGIIQSGERELRGHV